MPLYTRTYWQHGQEPPINPPNLNKIEEGIENAHLAVDAHDSKNSVRVASRANIDLDVGGLLTIDGIALNEGDRVLVAAQTNPAQNGIYVALNSPWIRAQDADTSAKITPMMNAFVVDGSQAGQLKYLTTRGIIELGVTPLTFAGVSFGSSRISSLLKKGI